jgi:hypothetical protein
MPSGRLRAYCGGGVLVEVSGGGVVVDCESLLGVPGGQSGAGPPARFGSHSGRVPGVPVVGAGGAVVSGVGCCVLEDSDELSDCCVLWSVVEEVDDCGSASARRIGSELCVLPVSAVLPVSESERML